MIGTKTFKTNELVLKIKKNSFDSTRYPLHEWERFIDILCENRDYQKESIKSCIIYLISDKYSTIEDVVEENFNKNDTLREKFNTIDNYKKKIQLPSRKSGCIDLATGTGKSYVIYGIAQIALGLGIVDKVLVLGPPSTTIEKGLTDKFNMLSSKPELRNAIPESSYCKSVEIIDANRTITSNCICVENINAVYSKTTSSIHDSLAYNGSSCLVLNDEIHHAYNKVSGNSTESKSIKKWREFLLDNSYNFKYIIGFTGTAYIDNDYFNDVIYRYSLKDAIADGFVKRVNYIDRNTDENENEKFQKILANHRKNQEVYSNIKPLTILVTKDIKAAKQLRTRLVEFLEQAGELGSENKVLRVTSDPEDKKNVLRLPFVDDKEDPTEWIISVAMLTEGWDVKNVLQIVPMEDRAFNSKLLIAQVLGRGLRIPKDYSRAEVTVFNHSRWSKNIKNLVQEVLELETTIKNGVITDGERSKYHFTLYNISYKKEKQEVVIEKDVQTFNYKSYFLFDSEVFHKESEIEYIKVGNQEIPFKQTYSIERERFLISDILDKIEESFRIRKHERILLNIDGEQFSEENLPSREVIETMIRNSMKRVGLSGDYLGKSNRDKVISAFNTLLRKKPKSVSINKTPDNLFEILTRSKQSESVSITGLVNDTSVFFSTEYENEVIDKDSLELLKTLSDDRQYRGSLFDDGNIYDFKTPVDIIFTHGDPEEKFVKELLRNENAQCISSWVKSNNQSFYSLEYSIRKGSHSTNHLFSPDFFIRIVKDDMEYISVVEIKADGDDCDENVQKSKYAKEHFAFLNDELKNKGIKQLYLFNFLSPTNYAEYFEYLRNGSLTQGQFVSRLDNLLEERLGQNASIQAIG